MQFLRKDHSLVNAICVTAAIANPIVAPPKNTQNVQPHQQRKDYSLQIKGEMEQ